MRKKKYWAGYCNNKIAATSELYGGNATILAIYLYRKDAKENYKDVRPVEIRELTTK